MYPTSKFKSVDDLIMASTNGLRILGYKAEAIGFWNVIIILIVVSICIGVAISILIKWGNRIEPIVKKILNILKDILFFGALIVLFFILIYGIFVG